LSITRRDAPFHPPSCMSRQTLRVLLDLRPWQVGQALARQTLKLTQTRSRCAIKPARDANRAQSISATSSKMRTCGQFSRVANLRYASVRVGLLYRAIGIGPCWSTHLCAAVAMLSLMHSLSRETVRFAHANQAINVHAERSSVSTGRSHS